MTSLPLTHYATVGGRADSYPLTQSGIPNEVVEKMAPWIKGFVGLSGELAQGRLLKRWEEIEDPELQNLARTLSKFAVNAVVDFEEGCVIAGARTGSDGSRIGDTWYLPAALEREYWKERLRSFRLDRHSGVVEFFYYFGGLAENTFEAGSFRYCEEEWPLFGPGAEKFPGYDWPESVNDFPVWHGSLCFYQALNGCDLLLRPNGAVGWWIMQEQRVEVVAASFEEFVSIYAKHWDKSWPFDPYSSAKN